MAKKYTTYTRRKMNDNYYADPNTKNGVEEVSEGKITLIETPYEVDGVFISFIEYDIDGEELEYYRTLDSDFNFTFKTEEEINIMLATLGEVSVENFVFTDNRPIISIGEMSE